MDKILQCKMIGGGFQHQECVNINNYKSKNFIWTKNNSDIEMFIDNSIYNNLGKSPDKKYAWIFESEEIFNIDFFVEEFELLSCSYTKIFTHNKKLLDKGLNFCFIPANSFWIETPFIHEKNKLISMVASNKNLTTGHRFRNQFIRNNPNKFDLFGFGYKPIQKKEIALNHYMFSIVIENSFYDNYFTEKILDCFATGTIPIYKGCDNINEFFDENGIIKLTDDFDFKSLNKELYNSKIDAIKKNFNLVQNYKILEDIIYQKITL